MREACFLAEAKASGVKVVGSKLTGSSAPVSSETREMEKTLWMFMMVDAFMNGAELLKQIGYSSLNLSI